MAILNEEKIEKNSVVIENLIHDSSNILKTSYNYNTKQLVATFKKGGVYNYDAIPEKIYKDFKDSPSSGVYLNGFIKTNYKVSKRGDLTQAQLNELLMKIAVFKAGE